VTVGISNTGGNADSSTLHVALSGLQLVSAKVDRGPGCTTDGGDVTCPLDFFNSGLSSSEELNVRVTSLPATLTASVSSSPTGTSETATWSGAAAPTSATPAASTVVTPLRKPVTARSPLTLLSVKASAPRHVTKGRPAITVHVKLAKPAKLELKLLDGKGRVLTSWSKRGKQGNTVLKLALPAKARHAGHDKLGVTVAGGNTRTVPLVLRA
jgi:hypothetical protein